MLTKNNKEILKTLNGEYLKFAKKLKNAVFSHCSGNDAINDTLCDIFLMLAEAQTDNRVFSDVIPDADKTIRETIACLPIKRLRRLPLVCALAAVAILCVLTAILLIINYSPIQLESVTEISYDYERGIIRWNNVPNATKYSVRIDGEEIAETKDNSYYVKLKDGTYQVSVSPLGEGRYHAAKYVFNKEIFVAYPRVTVGICDLLRSGGSYDRDWSSFLYYSNKNYKALTVCFKPEINFYGRITFYKDVELEKYKINGRNGNKPDEEMLFTADTVYEYTLRNTTVGFDFMYYYFSIDLRDALSYLQTETPVLPELALFALGSGEYPDAKTAYTTKDGSLSFMQLTDEEIQYKLKNDNLSNSSDFIKSFCPAILFDWYVIIRKDDNVSKHELCKNEITLSADGGLLNLDSREYTALRVPGDLQIDDDTTLLWYIHDDTIINEVPFRFVRYYNIEADHIYVVSGSSIMCYKFHSYKDKGLLINNNTTLTLNPGITPVNLTSVYGDESSTGYALISAPSKIAYFQNWLVQVKCIGKSVIAYWGEGFLINLSDKQIEVTVETLHYSADNQP